MEGNQLQEQISNLVVDGARGPVRMEMQLRYLLELTLEGNVNYLKNQSITKPFQHRATSGRCWWRWCCAMPRLFSG